MEDLKSEVERKDQRLKQRNKGVNDLLEKMTDERNNFDLQLQGMVDQCKCKCLYMYSSYFHVVPMCSFLLPAVLYSFCYNNLFFIQHQLVHCAILFLYFYDDDRM